MDSVSSHYDYQRTVDTRANRAVAVGREDTSRHVSAKYVKRRWNCAVSAWTSVCNNAQAKLQVCTGVGYLSSTIHVAVVAVFVMKLVFRTDCVVGFLEEGDIHGGRSWQFLLPEKSEGPNQMPSDSVYRVRFINLESQARQYTFPALARMCGCRNWGVQPSARLFKKLFVSGRS